VLTLRPGGSLLRPLVLAAIATVVVAVGAAPAGAKEGGRPAAGPEPRAASEASHVEHRPASHGATEHRVRSGTVDDRVRPAAPAGTKSGGASESHAEGHDEAAPTTTTVPSPAPSHPSGKTPRAGSGGMTVASYEPPPAASLADVAPPPAMVPAMAVAPAPRPRARVARVHRALPVAVEVPAPVFVPAPSIVADAFAQLPSLPSRKRLVQSVHSPEFPILLGALLAAFLVLFGRGDRRDPKLARSAVDGRAEDIGFS
jgi:hypothetical protein